MTHNEAAQELFRRGFRYSTTTYGEYTREYWTRSDGKPDVFLDHSATITDIGNGNWAISDFIAIKAAYEETNDKN